MAGNRAIYGISTAFFGEAPHRVSRSVLRGESKDNIRLIHQSTDILSDTTGKTIASAMRETMCLVEGVCAQRKAEGIDAVIPVVFGSPNNLDFEMLTEGLHRELGQNLRGAPEFSGLDLKTAKATIQKLGPMGVGFWKHLFDASIAALLRVADKDAVTKIEGRGFSDDETKGLGLSDDERDRIATAAVPHALRRSFHEIYSLILGGHTEPRFQEMLEATVRTIGRSQALYYGETAGDIRFAGRSSKPHLSPEGDVVNYICADPRLKDIYVAGFRETLGIRHNICVKTQRDPRSPPFADVAATYMADIMDARDNTESGHVMVNHSTSS